MKKKRATKIVTGASAHTLGLLHKTLGDNSMFRVTFDLTAEQFFQVLGSMQDSGPITMVKSKMRSMLDLEQVLQIVPISKSTLIRRLAAGAFPPGHFISPNRRVWYEEDIIKWQDSLNVGVSDRKRSERKPKPAAPKKKRAVKKPRR